MYATDNSDSVIGQLDGNISLDNSDTVNRARAKKDKFSTALNLPIVATYNARSLFPKIESFKTDMIERNISVSFVSEVWEKSEDKEHSLEVEKMLELNGLKYFSKCRPSNKRGGGVALVVNLDKYSCDKLNVSCSNSLEVIWGLLKPKSSDAHIRNIIVCSFYSPPNNGKNSKLADHIVGTLQMLSTKYPDCGIICGGDRNNMDIRPILNCGLKLKQVVDKFTRQDRILDILIMNLSRFYNSPTIAPPISPDDPTTGKDSDHSVPVCVPHTDRFNPPARTYRYHTYRPLPDSRVRLFGQWITGEGWEGITDHMSPSEQVETFEKIKLQEQSTPPTITEWETLEKINEAKKPKSGVPRDLPRLISKEFGIELSVPMCLTLNNIFKTVHWPKTWLQEYTKTKIPTQRNRAIWLT